MEFITELIGYLAAIIGTSIMIPQVLKTIKTKQVKDLSQSMLWLYFFNCLLWSVYGILIQAIPVIVCNTVALIISIIQLILKRKYN
jgi:MtN3 and saliva related transmembrane protein